MKVKIFKKFEIKKISKIIEICSQRAIFTFFFLFLIAMILGGILFLKYFILVKKAELKIEKEPLKLERRIYNQVLKIWEERKVKYEGVEGGNLLDVFQSH
jgi:lipid-A-disaccharide synthase-like uncharacterized protein